MAATTMIVDDDGGMSSSNSSTTAPLVAAATAPATVKISKKKKGESMMMSVGDKGATAAANATGGGGTKKAGGRSTTTTTATAVVPAAKRDASNSQMEGEGGVREVGCEFTTIEEGHKDLDATPSRRLKTLDSTASSAYSEDPDNVLTLTANFSKKSKQSSKSAENKQSTTNIIAAAAAPPPLSPPSSPWERMVESVDAVNFIRAVFKSSKSDVKIVQDAISKSFKQLASGQDATCADDSLTSYLSAVAETTTVDDEENKDCTTQQANDIMLIAAWLGHSKLLEEALKKGAKLDYKDGSGRNVLHYVVTSGNANLLRRLLKGLQAKFDKSKSPKEGKAQFAAELNAVANNGWTPFFIAVCRGYLPLVDILLAQPSLDKSLVIEHHCPPVKGEAAKSSAIHMAAVNGNESLIRILLKNGFSADEKDSTGRTPMHYAVVSPKSNKASIEALFQGDEDGHRLLVECDSKQTPLGLCIAYGKLELISYLMKSSWKYFEETGALQKFTDALLAPDHHSINCLQYASLRGHQDAIRLVSRQYRNIVTLSCHESGSRERHDLDRNLDDLEDTSLGTSAALWEIINSRAGNSRKSSMIGTVSSIPPAEGESVAVAHVDETDEGDRLVKAVQESLLRSAALESDMAGDEVAVTQTLRTVLKETDPCMYGQLLRAVKIAGTETALVLLNKTLEIEAAGGQMTSRGDRRKNAGGVFYTLLKEHLKETMGSEEGFRYAWRFIYCEQAERQKRKKMIATPSLEREESSGVASRSNATTTRPASHAAAAKQVADPRNKAPPATSSSLARSQVVINKQGTANGGLLRKTMMTPTTAVAAPTKGNGGASLSSGGSSNHLNAAAAAGGIKLHTPSFMAQTMAASAHSRIAGTTTPAAPQAVPSTTRVSPNRQQQQLQKKAVGGAPQQQSRGVASGYAISLSPLGSPRTTTGVGSRAAPSDRRPNTADGRMMTTRTPPSQPRGVRQPDQLNTPNKPQQQPSSVFRSMTTAAMNRNAPVVTAAGATSRPSSEPSKRKRLPPRNSSLEELRDDEPIEETLENNDDEDDSLIEGVSDNSDD